jgi:hypothetical protein
MIQIIQCRSLSSVYYVDEYGRWQNSTFRRAECFHNCNVDLLRDEYIASNISVDRPQ